MRHSNSREAGRLAGVLLLAMTLVSCGSNARGNFGLGGAGGSTGTGGGGTTQQATLVLFAEDAAADNMHSFEMTLTGVTLRTSGGTDVSLLATPVELEWVSRSLAPTLLSVTQVPATTYSQLEVLVSTPQMSVYNPSTQQFDSFSPSLTTSSVTIALSLTLSAGQVLGVRLDLDLLNSVVSNTQVTPRFDLVATSFQTGELPGDIDDALGTINSLDALNNRFTMTLVATGRQITVEVDSSTIFNGVVSSFGELATGQRVEVDARLQSSGRFRALVVEVDKLAATNWLRGLVTNVVRNLAGSATSLTLLVLEENPDQTGVDAGDLRTFSVDTNTSFGISAEDLTVFGLTFDRQELSPGQVVLVEPDSGQPSRAAQLILKQGTIPGIISSIGTTTFNITPLSAFFPDIVGQSFIVSVTAPETEFEDAAGGIGGLRIGQTVGVRGLLLFQFGQARLITKRVRVLANP